VTGAVLLDLYDTLACIGSDAIGAARRRGAELAGVDPDCLLDRWRDTVDARSAGRMGSPAEEIRSLLEGCGGAADEDLVRELTALEGATWWSGVRLYEDVPAALRALRRQGIRLAIVSNCSWQTAGVLEATGLAGAVDAVVLSFQVGLLKPDPAILRVALERLDADPASSVLVDDLAANLDAARALGMATVLMDRAGRGTPGHPAARDLTAAAAALGLSPPGSTARRGGPPTPPPGGPAPPPR
jgi:putative hydrolase of the HAD superfamily